MFRAIFILLSAAILAGCTANGPLFVDASPPTDQKALIYIYRADGVAFGARDAYFYIDRKNVFDLSPLGYSYVYADAGQHTLSQGWAWDVAIGETISTPITLKPGVTYFVRMESSISGNYIEWRLRPIGPIAGRAEIAQMHFQKPYN